MANFQQIINEHLDKLAEKDALFAEAYKNEKKSIAECCSYIISCAKKLGKEVCMTDDGVFGLAVHYYVEKDVKVPTTEELEEEVGISVSNDVQLSEEEIKEAKKEARERLILQELESMRKKQAKKQAKQEVEQQQLSLF